MLNGLRARFACGTNLHGVNQPPGEPRESEGVLLLLVSVGDLFAVHACSEEEDEGGSCYEEHGDVAIVHERVLCGGVCFSARALSLRRRGD
jgi:hypothetical protein